MTNPPATTGETPNVPESRRTSESVMRHVLQVAGFTEEETSYLLETKKLKSPLSLISLYDMEKLDEWETSQFPLTSVALLCRVAQYLKWHQKSHSGKFRLLLDNFDEDAFSTFMPESVLDSSSTNQSDPQASSGKRAGISVKITDYPTFSGKAVHWTAFYEKFVSVATLNGLAYLLDEEENESPDHLMKFSNNRSQPIPL